MSERQIATACVELKCLKRQIETSIWEILQRPSSTILSNRTAEAEGWMEDLANLHAQLMEARRVSERLDAYAQEMRKAQEVSA